VKSAVIGGKKYSYIDSIKVQSTDYNTVHIVQPSHNSIELTRLSIECIRRFTKPPYVIWVVDNNSNNQTRNELSKIEGINIIFNRTDVGTFWRPWYLMKYGGSIANGIALELAAKYIDGKYMFVMHNDCVPVKSGWLDFLKSKITEKVKIAGVSQDKTRVHAVHQSGFLFDFELYHKLKLSFMHNNPEYDVGDYITIGLKQNGYDSFVCKNSYNNPELDALFTDPKYPLFLRDRAIDQHPVDRCIDDENKLIYLHLGRGSKVGRNGDKRISVSDWMHLITQHFLAATPNQ